MQSCQSPIGGTGLCPHPFAAARRQLQQPDGPSQRDAVAALHPAELRCACPAAAGCMAAGSGCLRVAQLGACAVDRGLPGASVPSALSHLPTPLALSQATAAWGSGRRGSRAWGRVGTARAASQAASGLLRWQGWACPDGCAAAGRLGQLGFGWLLETHVFPVPFVPHPIGHVWAGEPPAPMNDRRVEITAYRPTKKGPRRAGC